MIAITLKEFPEAGFGYDVQINDEDATIGDYLAALDAFQAQYVADCRGCDGCCWERAPLGIADYFWGRTVLPDPCSLGQWLAHSATLCEVDGGLDLYLKRGADSACMFLDKQKQECARHLARPLVCRTHVCLPQSPRALELRSAIVNMLEDELVRRLLLENKKHGTTLPADWQEALATAKMEDYAPTPLSIYGLEELEQLQKVWPQIKIRQIVNVELWKVLNS